MFFPVMIESLSHMFCIKLDLSDYLLIFPLRLHLQSWIFLHIVPFLFNPGSCTAMQTLTFETEVVFAVC